MLHIVHKACNDSMTADEVSYSSNQVYVMINTGTQIEMAATYHHFGDETHNYNLLPTLPPPTRTANTLTDNNLANLAKFLQGNCLACHRKRQSYYILL